MSISVFSDKRGLLKRVLFHIVFILSVYWRAQAVTITFFSFNDIYDLEGTHEWGGYAQLRSVLEEERKSAKQSLTIVNGDFLGPSLISLETGGKHIVDLFHQLKIDAVVCGNHEFDFGPTVLRDRVSESHFHWLGSNIIDQSNALLPGFKNEVWYEVEGIKLALFGVCTQETKSLSNPGPELTFLSPIEVAKERVAAFKSQGADIIIAVTHQSLEEDIELARSCPGIHLILGGHDHFPATVNRYGTLIHKSGHDAKFLGRIDLAVKQSKNKMELIPNWKMIPVTNVAPHPETLASIQAVQKRAARDWQEREILLASELDTRQDTIRTKENGLGNLVADFVRGDLKADLAFINAGYMRGDALHAAGEKIKLYDFVKLVPFTDEIVLMEISGKDLLEGLKHSLSFAPKASKSFPHISGMKIVYDSRKGRDDRIIEVTIGSKPLDLKARYRVATLDFLVHGGDGFEAFTKGALLDEAHPTGPVGVQLAKVLSHQAALKCAVENRVVDLAHINQY